MTDGAKGFGEAHPHNPKVVSDMTALHHIHEPSLLFNLGERAKLDNQRPYTFMVRPEEGEGEMGGGRKREEERGGYRDFRSYILSARAIVGPLRRIYDYYCWGGLLCYCVASSHYRSAALRYRAVGSVLSVHYW